MYIIIGISIGIVLLIVLAIVFYNYKLKSKGVNTSQHSFNSFNKIKPNDKVRQARLLNNNNNNNNNNFKGMKI